MKDILSEESIMKLGSALIDMGIVTQCIERIQREVDISIESLGDYADKPYCQEIGAMGVGNVIRLGVCMSSQDNKSIELLNNEEWFTDAVSVVGEVIGFWGFKENHGRIWAFLYLSSEPVSTSSIGIH